MLTAAVALAEILQVSRPEVSRTRRLGPRSTATVILRKLWHLRLHRSGFRDLESPHDPDGPLSNAGQPSHLDDITTDTMERTADYYRRVGVLAMKLPFARDRQIAEMVAEGKSLREIKAELRVGQGRYDRVMRVIRSWVPPENWREAE